MPRPSSSFDYAGSNPLTAIDPLGLFRVAGGVPDCHVEYLRDKVPKLLYYLTIPPKLALATGAPGQEVELALSWGTGPTVVLSDLPESPGTARFGQFDPQRPDEIVIQRKLVEQLCRCPCDEAVIGLGISLLHELAHQLHFAYRGPEGPNIEAGLDFTDRTYDPTTYTRTVGTFYFGCNSTN